MTNLEKLISIGQLIYGENWQTPMAKLLNVDSRSIRRYVSGHSRPPYSEKLIEALGNLQLQVQEAIEIVNSDLVDGETITADVIGQIVGQYDYHWDKDDNDHFLKKSVIDAVNNSIYEKTYLS